MEYGRYGIRINTMSPGGTDITDRVTPRQLIRPGVTADEGDKAEAENYRREMAEDIRNQQAMRRRGLPEEQAAAIAFLASGDQLQRLAPLFVLPCARTRAAVVQQCQTEGPTPQFAEREVMERPASSIRLSP